MSATNVTPVSAASSQSRPVIALHQEIDRERRHDEQQRERRRHHVRHRIVDRRELGRGRKELQRPHEQRARWSCRSLPSSSPASAVATGAQLATRINGRPIAVTR